MMWQSCSLQRSQNFAHKIAMLVSLSWFLFQFGGRILGFLIPSRFSIWRERLERYMRVLGVGRKVHAKPADKIEKDNSSLDSELESKERLEMGDCLSSISNESDQRPLTKGQSGLIPEVPPNVIQTQPCQSNQSVPAEVATSTLVKDDIPDSGTPEIVDMIEQEQGLDTKEKQILPKIPKLYSNQDKKPVSKQSEGSLQSIKNASNQVSSEVSKHTESSLASTRYESNQVISEVAEPEPLPTLDSTSLSSSSQRNSGVDALSIEQEGPVPVQQRKGKRRAEKEQKKKNKQSPAKKEKQANLQSDVGIEGWNNSCYIDSTLFALFYKDDTFHGILLDGENAKDSRNVVSERVALQLRRIVELLESGYCSSSVVQELRNSMLHINPRLESSMMDVDQLISNLFGRALHVQPLIQYVVNEKVDVIKGAYNHQILINPSIPGRKTTALLSDLLLESMNMQKLKLKASPCPGFIIKMPRSNGSLVGCKRIVPNPVLDLARIMFNEEGTEANTYMLRAVIVLRALHYTVFVNTGKDWNENWVYFNDLPPSIVSKGQISIELQKLEDKLTQGQDVDISSAAIRQLCEDVHVCLYLPSS